MPQLLLLHLIQYLFIFLHNVCKYIILFPRISTSGSVIKYVQLFVTPWTTCSMPGFPVLHCLLEFAQIHVHRVGDAIQSSHPLSPPFPLPSIFPSIRVFFSESGLHIRWPKYRNFSVSISPSNDYSGLISFRIDLFVLLAVWTLKSLLQHHSLKASILWHSAFSVLQLSHLYMTTGKTKALTIWTYIDKVMSLMLSRFVIAFLQ